MAAVAHALAPEPGTAEAGREAGSFRDPAGFVFRRDGRWLRQVAPAYAPHLAHLRQSGLYETLTGWGWLIPHHERDVREATGSAAALLEPRQLDFISHPYEWSFGMWRDAALLTLDIQAEALARGMTLKDASAYNIQFVDGRPLFIDTLSFEMAEPGAPWAAYRQFCQQFLAPLALIARSDPRLAALSRTGLDGIPLDLASKLLPRRTWLVPGLLLHVHLHARAVQRQAHVEAGRLEQRAAATRVKASGVRAIVDSLRRTVAALEWQAAGSVWSDYYATAGHYGAGGIDDKERWVGQTLRELPAGVVWDLGANTGRFSRLAAAHHRMVIAWDFDPLCVERLYRQVRAENPAPPITPLVLDLANPSPSQGWAQQERRGLIERGPADVALALGLMHHLVLAAQVPLPMLAEFLARIARVLVIEFVPLEDPQAALLAARLRGRGHSYDQAQFETTFARHFSIETRHAVAGTQRVLYRLRRR